MIRAALFDIDGTLLDTERIYMDSWRMIAEQHGFPMPEEVLLNTRAVSHADARRLFNAIADGFDYDKLFPLRFSWIENEIEHRKPLLKPGVRELLDELRRRGIPCAAVTSTDRARTEKHLKAAELEPYFSAFVCGDDPELTANKPDPAPFLLGAKRLGVDPAFCIGAEDSRAGIRSLHSAGMKAFLIPDMVPPDDETRRCAYAILERIDELIPMLETL